jgi:hypothetical protein
MKKIALFDFLSRETAIGFGLDEHLEMMNLTMRPQIR